MKYKLQKLLVTTRPGITQKTKDAHTLNLRNPIRIETKAIFKMGKIEEIVREMQNYRINVLTVLQHIH